jgi:hypothetical protein
LTFSSVKILDDGTVPVNFTDNGVTYPVVKGTPCPSCLTYRSTVVRQGISYDVTQLVLQRASYTDIQNQVQLEKQLVVTVSWSVPRASTYRVDTILHNADPLAKPVIQGIRLEIIGTDGNLITDPDAIFEVVITDAGGEVARGETGEGVYQNFAMSVGSYTCTVHTTPSSQDYHPQGNSSGTSSAHTCSVSQNSTSTVTSTWERAEGCPVDPTPGGLKVTVKNSSGNPLSGAEVSLKLGPPDGSASPPNVTTGADGLATFSRAAGTYDYTVTKQGYDPATGSVCVHPGGSSTATATLIQPVILGQFTLKVKITNEDSNRTYQVIALNQSTGASSTQTITIKKDKNGTVTLSNLFNGTYTVTVCIVVGSNCNQLKVWTNQQFLTPNVTYGPTPPAPTGGADDYVADDAQGAP